MNSDQKFGYFFFAVFAIVSSYLFFSGLLLWAVSTAAGSFFFGTAALLRPQILSKLNRLWMRLGHLISSVVSPLILAALYFLLFTPVGLIGRALGRDPLMLSRQKEDTFWETRTQALEATTRFDKQY